MMSDQDDELTLADENVLNKYKMAAEVANSILSELIQSSKPGTNISELCEFGDKRIFEETSKLFRKTKDLKKGIAFPTAISVNNIICHYSPIGGEESKISTLADGDLVKIDLGAHVDGFAAVVGHTFVIGSSQENKVTGRKADVIMAAYTASEAVMRMLKPGNENFKTTEMITKVVNDFNCKPVEGMQSHQMKQMIYDADKCIILNPTEEQKKQVESCTFDVHEAWTIDLLVSTGDGKAREHAEKTTIYKRNESIYQLKMKTSRQFCSEIALKFSCYPFNIRSMDDLRKARLGATECEKHDLVQALPVFFEKEDDYVAQFKFTVLIMPNGPMRITGLPFDSTLYKSELKTKDAEVKQLLSQSIKIKKSAATANNGNVAGASASAKK